MPAETLSAAGRRNWTAQEVGRIKPLVFALALYPLARWLWLGLNGGLTANPPEFLIRSSGIWALVALVLTLAVTPLRRLIKQPALVRLRRMLGLFAFFYTCLHVLGWAFWERGWSLASMWDDVVQRTFILVGVAAFVPMAALAATSTRGWIHRMGRNWQHLHRSVYLVAALSVWHFWLVRAGKNDFSEPYLYGAVLAALLLCRLIYFYWRRPA
ncbi:protein-methionine-sulfoxide reductase heme-binding subunit MsrQ [Pusillimonas sp. SM2304]|uniref:sulfite oxidase heme-binding subunit YedZ n=1 Tax=Pusillimonas sp. SM2304 TaxID=3073241 RepID=UPI002875E24E|nr:protein-methionine-sulfoxide reductase heme-binding subunit MsrQ [Pusillimonas sp. SM2304]MDS1140942.1 protein-methionine-sulfoxide reductase heme-binding subunit MsrQ [Pusillimonas sp. SM2304]